MIGFLDALGAAFAVLVVSVVLLPPIMVVLFGVVVAVATPLIFPFFYLWVVLANAIWYPLRARLTGVRR